MPGSFSKGKGGRVLWAASLATLAVVASYIIASGAIAGHGPLQGRLQASSDSGGPRLVSVQPLPEMDGPACPWVPASASTTLTSALAQRRAAANEEEQPQPSHTTLALAARGLSPANAADVPEAVDADRPPERVIKDTYPTYSAIAVDAKTNEVFIQDENLFGINVFNRTDNTPSGANFTEPKRMLSGSATKLEFNCGLYIDPNNGDVYSVNNDTTDDIVVFPHDAKGNVAPMRDMDVPHGSFGLTVDEEKQELYVTVEHENAVVVFPKDGNGKTQELRRLEGPQTLLADPHGIVLDKKDGLMFISNHGSTNDKQAIGSGKFLGPEITVYPLGASGDTAPVRVIKGDQTQLDWPMAMAFDPARGDIYVANDTGNSVLVFRTTDQGNAAPARVIKGVKTQIKNPTGIYFDSKNGEVWIADMGNHRALAFKRTANGDVNPLRVIRSAPADLPALAIGNPGAVAYDSKRQEILVPN